MGRTTGGAASRFTVRKAHEPPCVVFTRRPFHNTANAPGSHYVAQLALPVTSSHEPALVPNNRLCLCPRTGCRWPLSARPTTPLSKRESRDCGQVGLSVEGVNACPLRRRARRRRRNARRQTRCNKARRGAAGPELRDCGVEVPVALAFFAVSNLK